MKRRDFIMRVVAGLVTVVAKLLVRASQRPDESGAIQAMLDAGIPVVDRTFFLSGSVISGNRISHDCEVALDLRTGNGWRVADNWFIREAA